MTSFEEDGVLTLDDLPCLPSEKQMVKGVAITECIQYIPCDPCVDSCPVNAISMKDVNALPVVDYDQCIACDACCVEAPRFFAMNDDEGHAFVKLQPKSSDELEECENALAACPVEAIGRDGEI